LLISGGIEPVTLLLNKLLLSKKRSTLTTLTRANKASVRLSAFKFSARGKLVKKTRHVNENGTPNIRAKETLGREMQRSSSETYNAFSAINLLISGGIDPVSLFKYRFLFSQKVTLSLRKH
jgi:hypothetical protein